MERLVAPARSMKIPKIVLSYMYAITAVEITIIETAQNQSAVFSLYSNSYPDHKIRPFISNILSYLKNKWGRVVFGIMIMWIPKTYT